MPGVLAFASPLNPIITATLFLVCTNQAFSPVYLPDIDYNNGIVLILSLLALAATLVHIIGVRQSEALCAMYERRYAQVLNENRELQNALFSLKSDQSSLEHIHKNLQSQCRLRTAQVLGLKQLIESVNAPIFELDLHGQVIVH